MLLRPVAIFVVALCMTTPAWAQDIEANVDAADAEVPTDDSNARTLFEAGLVAYNAARFQVALDNFQAAYELSQRPELLFNVGLAQERLGDDEAALASLQLYLDRATGDSNRSEVERRVMVIRARLASASREPEVAEPPSRTPDWIVLASGLALSVGGAVTMGVGLARRASVTGSTNGELEWPEAEARFDRGSAYAVGGAVSLGLGLALSAVSVVLLRGSRGTTVSTNGTTLIVSGTL